MACTRPANSPARDHYARHNAAALAWVFNHKLITMAYTANDVAGLLEGDSSFVDSSDDDLGFEIEEHDNSYFHAASIHGKNNSKI